MLTIILCAMWFLTFAGGVYHKERNNAVYDFRIMVLDTYGSEWYNTLPSYRRMVWSFKKLTIDNYLPKLKDFTV